MNKTIRGVLFDKDGTLFDFNATWAVWAVGALLDLARGDAALADDLAARIGFDRRRVAFDRASPVIAGTPEEVATLLAAGLPGATPAEVTARLDEMAAVAPLAEAVPLAPLMARLRAAGLKLGVATNDAEVPARAHLSAVGISEAFDFVAGYDSGFGGKPAPGMCIGFAEEVGLDPAEVVMVGDSLHDLHAGRAAGMAVVAVLTGTATAAELAPHADAVLPDIGHLPEWLSL